MRILTCPAIDSDFDEHSERHKLLTVHLLHIPSHHHYIIQIKRISTYHSS